MNSSVVSRTMRYLLMLGLFVGIAASCRPAPRSNDNRQDDPPVYPIQAEDLATIYRSGRPSPTWDGAMVQLRVRPKEYILKDRTIHLVPVGDAGYVVCYCQIIPADNTRPLVITGYCKGPVKDGIRRPPSVFHHVRVESCSVVME